MNTQTTSVQKQQPNVTQSTPPVQAKPSVAQPVSQSKPQSHTVIQKKKRSLLKIDWLFILGCAVVIVQIFLLCLLNKGKNEYNVFKKQDNDQIYLLQKVTTVSQEEIQNLEKSFLNEANVVSFIQTLEESRNIFDEFELSFTSDIPIGKDIQYLTFNVTATGSKENIQLFIQKLLGSTYAVEASQVDITVDKKDTTKWHLSLEGNIYLQNTK